MTREQLRDIQAKFAEAQKAGQVKVSADGRKWSTTSVALNAAIKASKK